MAPVSPAWFLGYAALLEFVFGGVCAVIAAFAFRLASKGAGSSTKRMGWSFLLLSLAYFVQSLANFLISTKLTSREAFFSNIYSLLVINTTGLYVHMLLVLAGFGLLSLIDSATLTPFWLTFIPSAIAIFSSDNPVYVFYLLSSVYLIFLSAKFAANYLRNRTPGALLVSMAFLLLLVGNVQFFISSLGTPFLYVLAHFISMVAYLMILANLYMVTRAPRK